MTQLTSREIMVRLGLSQNAVENIFNRQGINMIDEGYNLGDDDVKTLIRNFRKPGDGRPGDMISFKEEMNLHITVFFIHHKNCTSRSVDYSDITLQKDCALKKQQDMELTKDSKPEAPKINLRDFSNTYEAIIKYLR